MYKEQIEAYFAQKEAELVETISRLIRIPSTKGAKSPGKPFGDGPAAALEEALKISQELGLTGENLEGYVGVVDLNEKDTVLHILAHLDVVAAGLGWTVTEAFEPKVSDGLLYGRGASDDKGPLVAALFAMKAVKDLQIPLSHNVRFILGTDEESGFEDIHWYYANHPYAPYTFSPDSEFPLTNMEKGHLQPVLRKSWKLEDVSKQVIALSGSPQVNMVPSIAEATLCGFSMQEVQTHATQTERSLGVTLSISETANGLHLVCNGQGTHASTPNQGNNALTALIAIISELPLDDCESTRTLHDLHRLFPHGDHSGTALGLAQSDTISGSLTMTLTMMNWKKDGLEARFDCRTPLCADEQTCLLPAKQALSSIGISMEGALTPAHYVPEDSPFIQTLLRCYEQYTGQKGSCLSSGGGTYVHGIPGGVAFGACMPGFDSGLHGANERVSIADLLTSCKIFTQAIIDLCR